MDVESAEAETAVWRAKTCEAASRSAELLQGVEAMRRADTVRAAEERRQRLAQASARWERAKSPARRPQTASSHSTSLPESEWAFGSACGYGLWAPVGLMDKERGRPVETGTSRAVAAAARLRVSETAAARRLAEEMATQLSREQRHVSLKAIAEAPASAYSCQLPTGPNPCVNARDADSIREVHEWVAARTGAGTNVVVSHRAATNRPATATPSVREGRKRGVPERGQQRGREPYAAPAVGTPLGGSSQSISSQYRAARQPRAAHSSSRGRIEKGAALPRAATAEASMVGQQSGLHMLTLHDLAACGHGPVAGVKAQHLLSLQTPPAGLPRMRSRGTGEGESARGGRQWGVQAESRNA